MMQKCDKNYFFIIFINILWYTACKLSATKTTLLPTKRNYGVQRPSNCLVLVKDAEEEAGREGPSQMAQEQCCSATSLEPNVLGELSSKGEHCCRTPLTTLTLQNGSLPPISSVQKHTVLPLQTIHEYFVGGNGSKEFSVRALAISCARNTVQTADHNR